MVLARYSARLALIPLIALLLLRLLFPDHLACAQEATGDLRLRTVDTLGHPLNGVNVAVTGANIQGTRGCVSENSGLCVLLHLPPGQTMLRLSHANYQPVLVENVLVQLGKTKDLGDVVLRSHTYALPEVVISGSRPLIDPLTASTSVNLQPIDFEGLPLDRNYKSITTLVPQANASFFGDDVNVGGATGSENKYFIDGADVTDPHFQSTGTTLPYNFVKEIQVITGGYEAEYRSSLGGLINVVTPSGGNEFHGSAFGFYTNNRLTASALLGPLDLSQGPYSDYDVGVGLGGPVVRDQLWFYLAYNPSFRSKDMLIPGVGVYLDKTTMHTFGAKLSWMASEQLNFTLTSTGDPNKRQAVGQVDYPASSLLNPDPYLSNIQGGGINLSLKATYTAGDNLLIDGTFSRVVRDEFTVPSTELGRHEIVFWDTPTNTFSSGSFLTWSSYRTSTAAKVSATLASASHIVKGGVEYKDNGADVQLEHHYLQYNSTLTKPYFLWHNGDLSVTHIRLPSLFLQDIWQVLGWLTLNLGLRWDGQYLVGNDGRVHQRITNQYQPRVGFLVRRDGRASQKIYGSYGRYYEDLATVVAEAFYSENMYLYNVDFALDPRNAGVPGDTAAWSIRPGSTLPEVKGLRGQYYDEYTLGFEQTLGTNSKIRVEGLYRTLGEAVAGVLWDGKVQIGNPGRLNLTGFPKAQRDYSALAITVERRQSDHFNFIASYVISRNYGNYPGLYNVYFPSNGPNTSTGFFHAEGLKLGTGLLPNDRTHVLKASGSYRFDFGLSVGTSFIWQSGTPWSDIAGYDWFLAPRGTAGKTPAIWDVGARLAYEISVVGLMRTRLVIDFFHIASQRKPVDILQRRYLQVDSNGNPFEPNPNFGEPSRYQPPMSVRMGMEVSF